MAFCNMLNFSLTKKNVMFILDNKKEKFYKKLVAWRKTTAKIRKKNNQIIILIKSKIAIQRKPIYFYDYNLNNS